MFLTLVSCHNRRVHETNLSANPITSAEKPRSLQKWPLQMTPYKIYEREKFVLGDQQLYDDKTNVQGA